MRTAVLSGLMALLSLPTLGQGAETRMFEPIEWTFINPSHSGNPFDLVATATFSHATAADIVTELFFDGGDRWKLRFTGTAVGQWSFRTSSADPDLDGLTGSVTVTSNPGSPGFIRKFGQKWGRSGLNQAYVPQLVMFPEPNVFFNEPGEIDERLETFIGNHGFSGFHTAVLCYWFDINQRRCENLGNNPNPDRRTFEALENLILKTYAAGGVVHLWAWGDQMSRLTPIPWGINGAVDRRLQRYIAARLGPLPGWSMGYGYDLDEWVAESELHEWRNYMQPHLGWFHFLGGRPEGPNSGTDHSEFVSWNEPLDYSSYEHHRPTYNVYVAAMANVPGQPVFSEDRYRVRPDNRPKDYSLADTRRGLWVSTMAGGIANIWGYRTPIPDDAGSLPYPNAAQLLTYARFWKERFKKNLVRDNRLTDGLALRKGNTFYVFYRENRSSIAMDLSEMAGDRTMVAVDTTRPYEEIPLGTLPPGSHRFEAPYRADWAIAVGGPQPGTSITDDLGLVDAEAGLFRVNVGDGDTRAAVIGGRDCRRNDDPSSDLYQYFNVVGSYAFEGNRPEVRIAIDYFDTGAASLRLQYDSFAAPYTTHEQVVRLTNTNTWKQATWTVADAFFGNRQNNGADFRIHRQGSGPFYLDVVEVSIPPSVPPAAASEPTPANGSSGVTVLPELSWTGGAGATSHDVYFGDSSPPPFQRNQTSTTFAPGTLLANTTYFWRIDEVNPAGTTTGEEWNFTTGESVTNQTLNIKEAGLITIDGDSQDWNLSEFSSKVRAGEVVAGDIALTGFDAGVLYFAGRATPLSLPTDPLDHTARVYSRHDARHLYFLVRVDDDDIQAPHGQGMNWANDCVEFYIDPSGDGGTAALSSSTSDIQLVIDVANQRNVYVTTSAYRNQVLGGVSSAVSVDSSGWWLEVEIDKNALEPALPTDGSFGLDFNFRDNDDDNNPSLSTVYTWADFEESGSFPSKIPDRWGEASLATVSEVGASTVEIRSGDITVDGNIEDWNLSELTRIVRAGDLATGDAALVGFDSGTLYWAGRFTGSSLPTSAADHTARVYSRHSAEHLYFLIRLADDDLQLPFGPEMNWANDSAEIYIDPSLDGGAVPMQNSSSDFQLVIDGNNQVNVYMTTSAYRDRLLSGIDSAVTRDATGWWAELRIDKTAISPALSSEGSFGLDFNFRDNDRGNDPTETTVYCWSDFEQSGSFPSKIPNRWGRGRLLPLPPEPPPE